MLVVIVALALLAAFGAAGPRDGAAQQALQWAPCGGPFECAALTVPLRYDDPAGPTTRLDLVRLPASGPASQRIGSLLANPGGPGSSGVSFVRGWAPQLDPAIRARFDIVGWDPRGVGSNGISCGADIQGLFAIDPSPDSDREWDDLSGAFRSFAAACAARDRNGLLATMGTRTVARDLDRIRAALGDDGLTYVGYSYGTVIGQVYADLFPGNVRAMVLDGAVDLSQSPAEQALQQALGFERALAAYLDDCRARSCALASGGRNPGDAIDEVLRRAEAAPIPAPSADRPAGPGEAFLAVIQPLYSESLWPRLTQALSAALGGDGAGLVRLADDYLRRQPDGSYSNLVDANIAVNCIDSPRNTDLATTYEEYRVLSATFARQAPRLGAAFAAGVFCLDWPATADPLAPPDYRGSVPIVVVSTTHDPATPHEWGVAVRQQLGNARLIVYGGDGHTVYGSDGCVDRAVNAYLLSLRTPQDGLTCGDPARVPASPGSPAAPGSPTVPGSPAAPQEVPAAGGRQAGGFGPGLVVGLVVGGGVALLVAGTTMLALRRWAR